MKGAIQRIFQDHGEDYVRENLDSLSEQQAKTIGAIQRCGTPAAGWIRFRCADCSRPHLLARSCGNRMCPSCQSAKTADWLGKRLSEQLPTHYFLITFTVPEQLNPFFIHKPKEGLSALFKAASGALKSLARNPRFLGVGLPGFLGVLHTWGRTLNFHPHVHFVVPGGGIDREKGLWRSSREDFYAPGQALAKVFKGMLRDQVERDGLLDRTDPDAWTGKWVVDCQAAGQNREGILKYLAPYVFRTAITDSRIVAVGKGKVTFTYVKSGSNRPRRMTLDAHEFIRRYLMHVLPSGFMRVRHYGFMGAGCAIPHEEVVALVRMAQGLEVDPIEYVAPGKEPFLCPGCKGPLVAECILSPTGHVIASLQRNTPARE